MIRHVVEVTWDNSQSGIGIPDRLLSTAYELDSDVDTTGSYYDLKNEIHFGKFSFSKPELAQAFMETLPLYSNFREVRIYQHDDEGEEVYPMGDDLDARDDSNGNQMRG